MPKTSDNTVSGLFFSSLKPRLFGHRGYPARFPENTMPSFQAAWDEGVRYFELDVWATRDGEIVVHHDESAYRTCGKDQKITIMTMEECRRLDAGYSYLSDDGSFQFRGKGIGIPTLAEVLQTFPDALITIEVKQQSPPIGAMLREVIQKTGSGEKVLLAAEHHGVMQNLRDTCRGIPTSLSFLEIVEFYQRLDAGKLTAYRPPGQALQIPLKYKNRKLVTPAAVEAAHAVGLEMHLWTINNAEEMKELLDAGVDGIMSDDARLLVMNASK